MAEERLIRIGEKPVLADPLTMGDMERAVKRMKKAIDMKETIGIIGDYDADGITGTAQMIRLCQRYDLPHHVILPHRVHHGYGIKQEFIHDLAAKQVTLLVTIDTGIAHANEIAIARSAGMEVMVLDHHVLPDSLPDALILHPRINPDHANPHLCGSGVVFTFLRGLLGDTWDGCEVDLALAGIGTVADVVPLTGENRAIAQLALHSLNKGGEHPVFTFTRSVMKGEKEIRSSDIGFRIAPRINAAGRIADPVIALNALLKGGAYIDELHTLNTDRQEKTADLFEHAEEEIDFSSSLIAYSSPLFHPGIIGLIAGRLTEKHGKPTLIGSTEGDLITCSLRSIPGYDVAAALSRCTQYLTSHGGHAMAGGCTLYPDQWDAFSQAMKADASERLDIATLAPSMMIDAELSEDDLTLDLVNALNALEPFGEGNPEPRFLVRNLTPKNIRSVGKNGDHLSCIMGNVKSIGFRLGHLAEEIDCPVDIVCRLGIEEWNGATRLQVFVEDIAVNNPMLQTSTI